MADNTNDKISLRDAISIGIGGMVGGGIFAVLGLAVDLAKGATPLAFLVAGIIAFITGYSYSKLSIALPDKGGTVKFINHGFGETIFSGGLNNLLWISYIIMLSLYASAFGSYASNYFTLINKSIDFHIYTSVVILLATLVNYLSVKIVGQIESAAVIIKLIILIGFIFIGGYGLIGNENLAQLNPSNWEPVFSILAGGMVIFVAYEGFELIANAAPDISNPGKNIQKAYLYSIGFVILLYIAIAFVVVGSLPFSQIKSAEEYVLAEAAKPMLGQLGFTLITIAALISTFSAINATILGGSRVSYEIAEDNELPKHLTAQLWNRPIGLIITAAFTLLFANILNLESISTTGSMGFLLIFGIVNYVAFKMHKEVQSNQTIALIGFVLCMIALIALIIQQSNHNMEGVFIALGLVVLSFVIEWIYKRINKD